MIIPKLYLVCLAWWVLRVAADKRLTISSLCNVLAYDFKDRVFFPNSPPYNASLSSYYSAQESELRPGCIFSPTQTSEVVHFVNLVNPGTNKDKYGSPVPFAIRSGGHTVWSGAANIDGGITIDLRLMNQTILSRDRKIVSLGPGAIWSDVYPKLIPYNLTVMGGRVAGIGVGGFLTGGTLVFVPLLPFSFVPNLPRGHQLPFA